MVTMDQASTVELYRKENARINPPPPNRQAERQQRGNNTFVYRDTGMVLVYHHQKKMVS